jgi:hypothetical protein
MDTPKENALCGACINLIVEPSIIDGEKMSSHGFFNCKLQDRSAFHSRSATCTLDPIRFIPLETTQ